MQAGAAIRVLRVGYPALPALLAAVLLMAAAAAAAVRTAAAPRITVLAHGLDNPRKIFLGAGGAVYVVEAGSGAPLQRPGGCRGTCIGETGAIVRVVGHSLTTVVSGLGSAADVLGEDAEGPAAVLVDGKSYDVLMEDMDITDKGVNRLGLPDAGDLISTPAGRVSPTVIANLAAFEAAHNPDHGAGPGAKYGQPPIDSDPYDFVPYRGGFAVVDAAGNDLLWVDPHGRISVLAVFPIQIERLTTEERDAIRAPASMTSFKVQSVPTCVAVGPDGALYVGELTGWPYQVGRARIWRVVPGHPATIYASGFTTISDMAFQGKNLLVLELASRGLLDPTSPGALIRLAPDGARTLLLSAALSAPTGVAVGNGSIYISNDGVYPGSGQGPHGELVSIPASTGS